jgi:hypothetical protein
VYEKSIEPRPFAGPADAAGSMRQRQFTYAPRAGTSRAYSYVQYEQGDVPTVQVWGQLDLVRSSITFSARHAPIATVLGRFDERAGSLDEQGRKDGEAP